MGQEEVQEVKVPPTDEEAVEPVENGTLDEEPLPVRVSNPAGAGSLWDVGPPVPSFSRS